MTPARTRVLHTYLDAKDLQRPHLFADVFTSDARFQSRFAFEGDFGDGSPVFGLPAITDTFRALGAHFENIYTVYLDDTVTDGEELRFDWIVAMTDRTSREARVAWGDYAWRFTDDDRLATDLDVLMLQMDVLPPEQAPEVAARMHALPHPWLSRNAARRGLDALPLPALHAWLEGPT